jgi:hypothetical protein
MIARLLCKNMDLIGKLRIEPEEGSNKWQMLYASVGLTKGKCYAACIFSEIVISRCPQGLQCAGTFYVTLPC